MAILAELTSGSDTGSNDEDTDATGSDSGSESGSCTSEDHSSSGVSDSEERVEGHSGYGYRGRNGYEEGDEEEERMFEFAKYWCPTFSEVVAGVESRSEPLESLNVLCGTYHWFYQIQNYWDPAEVHYEGNETGRLVISCPEGETATLDNISGNMKFYDYSGHFAGLAPFEGLPNWWDAQNMVWDGSGNPDEEDNGIEVLKVSDDDGNPFIAFNVYHGPGRSGGYHILLGKKQPEGLKKPTSLTGPEYERLGMSVSNVDIAKAARKESRREMRKLKKLKKQAAGGDKVANDGGTSVNADPKAMKISKRKVESDGDEERQSKVARKV